MPSKSVITIAMADGARAEEVDGNGRRSACLGSGTRQQFASDLDRVGQTAVQVLAIRAPD